MTNSTQSDSRPLEELVDLSVGLGILLMPLSPIVVPGLLLFVVLPAALLALPLAIVAAVVAPPILLGRRLLRR